MAIEPKQAMPRSDVRRKLIEFDIETFRALEGLARDRMQTFQELADEGFRDLLKKHRRPVTLKEALRESMRTAPANDEGPRVKGKS